MPYCKGPYSAHSSLPSPVVMTLHSSRKVDFARRVYVMADDGNNFDSMPSTRQRVFLQLDFAVGPPPKFMTEPELERRKRSIIAGMQLLIDEGAISLTKVTVEESAAGSVVEEVFYVDLQTGKDDSVSRG